LTTVICKALKQLRPVVVFRNAKPSKNEYRHFTIKTVVGANDFASMEEIVYRRYKRLLERRERLTSINCDRWWKKGNLLQLLTVLKD
jgi:hypothetical protein